MSRSRLFVYSVFHRFAALICLGAIVTSGNAVPPNARVLGNSPGDRVRHANLVISTGRYAEGLEELLALWKSERLKGPKVDKTHLDILEILAGFGDIYPPAHEAFEKLLKEEVNPLNDCNAHLRLAKLYASMSHYPEGLSEFVWCWDNAPGDDAYAMSQRRGPVAQGMAALAREYPPALEALRKRYDKPRFPDNRKDMTLDRDALDRALKSLERPAE